MIICFLCGKELIPDGSEPMIPKVEGKKIIFRRVHKKCYNKAKEGS